MKKRIFSGVLCCAMVVTALTGFSASPASVSAAAAKAPANKELYSFTMIGNMQPEMKDYDVAYFKGLEQALNLKITVELPPATSYVERLQLMMASGEYADTILFPNHTDPVYVDSVKGGIIIALNKYLDNSPNLKKYSYQVSWDTLKTMKDDKIYAIPRTSIARADGYLIRQDWLDTVGLSIEEGKPVTLAKLEEIFTAFSKKDPDKNGANDTYGFTSNSDSNGNIDVLFPWAFGLTGWHEYNGEYMDLKYSKTDGSFKRALEYSNKLWKAGVIDPDWPTIKRDVSIERFKKGIAGSLGEFSGWLTDTEKQAQSLNPKAKLSYITAVIAKEGDKPAGGTFSTGFWGEWGITTAAKKPERIVEMFDYILSDNYWDDTNYGPKGIMWNEKDGVKVATDKFSTSTVGRAILRRNNAPEFFVSLAQSAADRVRIEKLIGICIDQMVFPLDKGYRTATKDDPKFIDYEKDMGVKISKIIVGDLPVSEWDKVLDGWYKAGGEKHIKEMQDYIKAQK